VITHAHADHVRPGSALYIASHASLPLLRHRLPRNVSVLGVREGQRFRMGKTWVSLHPAGHILGSVQVRVEQGSQVWVCSGDYKRDPDPTCQPFEVVPCDTFITEATFGLPAYRWEPCATVAASIAQWHDANRAAGRASILLCYALGKAQRLLAELQPWLDGPVWLHAAMLPLVDAYREAGVTLPPTRGLSELPDRRAPPPGLVLAPPSAVGNRVWMRRFGQCSVAFASGWMRLRGQRLRRPCDRGFVVSDHADWPSLLRTIRETGARRVLVTHGRSDVLVRYLREVEGLDASAIDTSFTGEDESASPPEVAG
jgi:putative mRNA 3-end processing factor